MNLMNRTHLRSTQINICSMHLNNMSAAEEFEEHTKEFILLVFTSFVILPLPID